MPKALLAMLWPQSPTPLSALLQCHCNHPTGDTATAGAQEHPAKKMLNDGDPTALPTAAVTNFMPQCCSQATPEAEDPDGPACVPVPTIPGLAAGRRGRAHCSPEQRVSPAAPAAPPAAAASPSAGVPWRPSPPGSRGRAGLRAGWHVCHCRASLLQHEQRGSWSGHSTSLGSRMPATGSPQGLSCGWACRKLDLHKPQRAQ